MNDNRMSTNAKPMPWLFSGILGDAHDHFPGGFIALRAAELDAFPAISELDAAPVIDLSIGYDGCATNAVSLSIEQAQDLARNLRAALEVAGAEPLGQDYTADDRARDRLEALRLEAGELRDALARLADAYAKCNGEEDDVILGARDLLARVEGKA